MRHTTNHKGHEDNCFACDLERNHDRAVKARKKAKKSYGWTAPQTTKFPSWIETKPSRQSQKRAGV